MKANCIYCQVEPADSKDHIFPQFLGGTKSVYIGKNCNNSFGHSFEAKVYESFIPLMIGLRFNRIPTPRYVLWKNAFTYEGVRYNIDSNLKSIPYKPSVVKDEIGRISQGFGSKDFIKEMVKHFKREARGYKIVDNSKEGLRPDLTFDLPLNLYTRRLALKMCISLSRYLQPEVNVVDVNHTKLLLNQDEEMESNILLDVLYRNEVEEIKPPLSHMILIEGSKINGLCYGIVQFYGMIQFYVPLNDNYEGHDFSYISLLDTLTFTEVFKNTNHMFNFEPPPRNLHLTSFSEVSQLILKRFNYEAQKRFGENRPNFI